MSQVIAESQSLGLARYGTVLRRRRFIVLLGVVLGLGAAAGYLYAVTPHSAASTLVTITVISDDPFNPQRSQSDLIDAQTELQTVRSSAVLTTAAADLPGNQEIIDMRAQVKAVLLENGTVIRITYTAATPEQARGGADAIADAYLDYRSQQADVRRDTIAAQLEDRRAELTGDLRRANARVATSPPNSPERARAEAEVQVLLAQANELASQVNSLSGLDTNGGSILSSAAENPVSTGPRKTLTVATGFGAGLLLGLAGAFLVNVLDRRVRDDYDVAGAHAGRVIGTLGGGHGLVPAMGDDRDIMAASRERLLAEFDPHGGALAIIDLTRGHGPSDVPLNLAILLAESHNGLDLMLPEWPEDDVTLLLDALEAERSRSDSYAEVTDLQLRIITQPDWHGQSRGGWMNLLRDTISRNEPQRCLVIAVPPHSSRAVRLAAARLADATLLVAELSATRIGDLARQATDMQAVRTAISGTLLVGHRRSTRYAVDDDESAVVADAEPAADEHDATSAQTPDHRDDDVPEPARPEPRARKRANARRRMAGAAALDEEGAPGHPEPGPETAVAHRALDDDGDQADVDVADGDVDEVDEGSTEPDAEAVDESESPAPDAARPDDAPPDREPGTDPAEGYDVEAESGLDDEDGDDADSLDEGLDVVDEEMARVYRAARRLAQRSPKQRIQG